MANAPSPKDRRNPALVGDRPGSVSKNPAKNQSVAPTAPIRPKPDKMATPQSASDPFARVGMRIGSDRVIKDAVTDRIRWVNDHLHWVARLSIEK